MASLPFCGLDELAAAVPDGAKVAVPNDPYGVAVAATRALVRRGASGLHLVCIPTSGIQADVLIGAGCVAAIETSAVALGEHGTAPRFAQAVRDGSLRVMDATCPAIHAGLLAGLKGVPFMPLRGVIGSDILAHRSDWKVIDNPFAARRPDPRRRRDPFPTSRSSMRRGPTVRATSSSAAAATFSGWRRRPAKPSSPWRRSSTATCSRTATAPRAWSPRCTSRALRSRSAVPHRWDCPATTTRTPRRSRAMRGRRRRRRGSGRGSTSGWRRRLRRLRRMNVSPTELLIATIARLLGGCRNVVIGNASPDPRLGRAARARARRRRAAADDPRLAQVHRLHRRRRRRRSTAPRRGESTRSSSAAGRSTAKRTSTSSGRGLSAERCPLAGLVRLGLSLLPGAESDPLSRGALAAGVRVQGRFRLGAGDEPAGRLPAGRAVEAPHRARAVRFRPRAQAVHAGERPSRGTRSRRSSRTPDSTSTGPAAVPATPEPDAQMLALIRGRVRDEIAETYPKFAAGLAA